MFETMGIRDGVDLETFITSERAGILYQRVQTMNLTTLKRRRQVIFGELVKVIKGLGLVSKGVKIVGIYVGCNKDGETGVMISCYSPTKVVGQTPTESP